MLMDCFDTTQNRVFCFCFYPSDLCKWVRDLREVEMLRQTPESNGETESNGEIESNNEIERNFTTRRNINAPKFFEWPSRSCCRKGQKLD